MHTIAVRSCEECPMSDEVGDQAIAGGANMNARFCMHPLQVQGGENGYIADPTAAPPMYCKLRVGIVEIRLG